MIQVIDLPGVRAIEARINLNALTATRQDHELDQMVERIVTETLGVHGDTREMIWEAIYYAVLEKGGTQDLAQHLANNRKPRSVQEWRDDGWDVTGDDGQPLLSLGLLEGALLCISAGLTGRMRIEIEKEIWGAKKEAEANTRPARPTDKTLDATFLGLGASRRRGLDA